MQPGDGREVGLVVCVRELTPPPPDTQEARLQEY